MQPVGSGALFLSSGNLLDVAGGVGRHAIFYAKLGWRATLIDVSEEGVTLAKRNAAAADVKIETIVADLNHWDWAAWKEQFDLVLVFFYLQRELFPALESVLKPGGLLIYKTYLHGGKRGPSHPMFPLNTDELPRSFPNLKTLHYEEKTGESSVAEFVGRRHISPRRHRDNTELCHFPEFV